MSHSVMQDGVSVLELQYLVGRAGASSTGERFMSWGSLLRRK